MRENEVQWGVHIAQEQPIAFNRALLQKLVSL